MTAQKSHGKQCQNICQITTSPIELIVSCYLVWFTLRVCSIAAFALLGYIDYLWYFITNRLFFLRDYSPPPPLSLSLCCVSKYGPNPFCFKHQTHGNQRTNKYGGGCFVLNFTSAICIAPLEDVRRLTAHPQSSPSIVITRFLKVVWAFCERQNVVFAPQCSYAKQYETHHRWEEKVEDRLVLSPVHLGLA